MDAWANSLNQALTALGVGVGGGSIYVLRLICKDFLKSRRESAPTALPTAPPQDAVNQAIIQIARQCELLTHLMEQRERHDEEAGRALARIETKIDATKSVFKTGRA